VKTKHAAAKPSPCKGLDEAACGGNKACKWTAAATPDAAGKVAPSHCSAVAAVKKKPSAKTAKSAAPEVLPWAPKATPAASGSDGSAPAAAAATNDAQAKPAAVKKVTTAAAKKKTPTPKAEVAPPVPAASDGTQDAPSSASSPAPESDPQ
jgi:hypothetical protein